MFRAFADFTRLRLLHLLAQKELCVCEMMAALRAPQSKISRHLGYLRESGLVSDRRAGKWRYYSLAKPTTRFQARIFQCLAECKDEVSLLQRDMDRARRAVASRRAQRRA